MGVRPSSSSESAMQIQTTTTTQQTSYTHSHSIPRGLGMNTEISWSAPSTYNHHQLLEWALKAQQRVKGVVLGLPLESKL